MAEEKLITIREVALYLAISEKEVIELSESGIIPAYKIGGVYLRFKRQQVEDYRKKHLIPAHKHNEKKNDALTDRIADFFYLNDFYIIVIILIILLLFIIFQGY